MRVTVLGAGYMGSAMAVVAARRGHEVRLWGTWMDDALLDACERGEPHPRLKLRLENTTLWRASRLGDALEGSDLVVHAVSSDGAVPVMLRAASHLPDVPILSVTKGLLESPRTKRVDRIDRVVSEYIDRNARFVHAAGPAKAMELARGVLTWMQFAGNRDDAVACASALAGGTLVVSTSQDIAGAELCSAFKNAYATGLGLWDGYVGLDAHDARAACFTQAIAEMLGLVHGPSGIGDLHVTAAAGRNRAFGERVGRGTPAKQVAAEMLAVGELTEGYAAIATASRFAAENEVRDVPFLRAVHAIVWEGAAVAPTLSALRIGV
jgi:glycerol-3-phosphate dehydrogenase (NAD(P)+)